MKTKKTMKLLIMKESDCKHQKTHVEYVSGTHTLYKVVVCNLCNKVISYREAK